MNLRYKIGLIVFVLGSVFLLGRCGRRTTDTKNMLPAVLPSNEVERIQVNPDNHTLTIVTKTGTKTVTLPDRTSTIDVLKTGGVKVTSPQFGLEHHLFIGIAVSDDARLGIGADMFYWKRLDLGVGV